MKKIECHYISYLRYCIAEKTLGVLETEKCIFLSAKWNFIVKHFDLNCKTEAILNPSDSGKVQPVMDFTYFKESQPIYPYKGKVYKKIYLNFDNV